MIGFRLDKRINTLSLPAKGVFLKDHSTFHHETNSLFIASGLPAECFSKVDTKITGNHERSSAYKESCVLNHTLY